MQTTDNQIVRVDQYRVPGPCGDVDPLVRGTGHVGRAERIGIDRKSPWWQPCRTFLTGLQVAWCHRFVEFREGYCFQIFCQHGTAPQAGEHSH
ncbi:hypothetical protein KRM28CT15_31550 [Krasilnikovia sp. M28-CT-15]